MPIDKSLRALNRYTCREILDVLRRGPQSVAAITSGFKFSSRPNISQALSLLLDAGLVSRRHEGRQNFYQLQPDAFQELLTYLKGLQRDARVRSRAGRRRMLNP